MACRRLAGRMTTTISTKPQDKMQSAFLLNVIIAQCAAIFNLFAGKNNSLLVGWYTFFVLDFLSDGINIVTCFYVECQCLSCQRLDENLHTSTRRITVI